MLKRLTDSAKIFALSLLLLVLSGTYNPVLADEFNDHADFISDQAYLFITIKHSDDHAQALNQLLTQIETNFHGELPVPQVQSVVLSLIELMEVTRHIEDSVRIDEAWLGDKISLTVQNVHENRNYPRVDGRIIIDIADLDAFFEHIQPDTVIETHEEYTLLNDEMIIIGNTLILTDIIPASEIAPLIINEQSRLSASATYQEGLDALPMDDYPITGYMDTGALAQEIYLINRNPYTSPQLTSSDPIHNTVFGVYYPDDRTISADFVTPSVTLDGNFGSISADFAENIPADTHIVLHGYDADLLLQTAVNALNKLSPLLQENLDQNVQIFNMGGLLKQSVITLFAGFTGLNLERDIVQQADEDYALLLNLIPDISWAEFAFLAHITDDDAIDYIFDSLSESGQAYGVDLTIQEHNLHAPNLVRNLLALEYGTVLPNPSLELSAIYRDDLLAIGSTPLVNASIGRDGTLAQQTIYQDGRARHDDDTFSMLYFNLPAITSLLDIVNPQTLGMRENELKEMQFIFAQLETVIISATTNDDSLINRLTITLSESNPYPFPETNNNDARSGAGSGE